ncbi:putative GATA-binding transcription factor [Cavenderia fasciculata]|uniref:GATA-binding transcription factor n=1 Tax=Cavenderia fasciculata TaxID=261658 RepID=F4PHD3_CACFS|nr:putative GATA-binding transcription factor [Cavenderia fasciculata]EGG25117.1 putative GATA-binding transcription factor [Cavenderia fasciculata]|eukprot:XP_004362968.1 putative GATA-binding transcription factor [Cavenderia fasciculata]
MKPSILSIDTSSINNMFSIPSSSSSVISNNQQANSSANTTPTALSVYNSNPSTPVGNKSNSQQQPTSPEADLFRGFAANIHHHQQPSSNHHHQQQQQDHHHHNNNNMSSSNNNNSYNTQQQDQKLKWMDQPNQNTGAFDLDSNTTGYLSSLPTPTSSTNALPILSTSSPSVLSAPAKKRQRDDEMSPTNNSTNATPLVTSSSNNSSYSMDSYLPRDDKSSLQSSSSGASVTSLDNTVTHEQASQLLNFTNQIQYQQHHIYKVGGNNNNNNNNNNNTLQQQKSPSQQSPPVVTGLNKQQTPIKSPSGSATTTSTSSANLKLPSFHHLELEAEKTKQSNNNNNDDSVNSPGTQSSISPLPSPLPQQPGQQQQKKRKSKPSKYSIPTSNTLPTNAFSSSNTMVGNYASPNLITGNSSFNTLPAAGDFMLNYHNSNSSTPNAQSSAPSPLIGTYSTQSGSSTDSGLLSSPTSTPYFQPNNVLYKNNSTTTNSSTSDLSTSGDYIPAGGNNSSTLGTLSNYLMGQQQQQQGVGNQSNLTPHSPPYPLEFGRATNSFVQDDNNMLQQHQQQHQQQPQQQQPKQTTSSSSSSTTSYYNSLKSGSTTAKSFGDYSDHMSSPPIASSTSSPSSAYSTFIGNATASAPYAYFDLSHHHVTQKKTHRRRPANIDKSTLFCHTCGTKSTPEWRRGPDGPATLCNACGLAFAKKQKEDESNYQKMLMSPYSYHRGIMHESYVNPSLLPLNAAAPLPYINNNNHHHTTSNSSSSSYLTFTPSTNFQPLSSKSSSYNQMKSTSSNNNANTSNTSNNNNNNNNNLQNTFQKSFSYDKF